MSVSNFTPYEIHLQPCSTLIINSNFTGDANKCFEQWKAITCSDKSEQIQLGVFTLKEPGIVLGITKYVEQEIEQVAFDLWGITWEGSKDLVRATVAFDTINDLSLDAFSEYCSNVVLMRIQAYLNNCYKDKNIIG